MVAVIMTVLRQGRLPTRHLNMADVVHRPKSGTRKPVAMPCTGAGASTSQARIPANGYGLHFFLSAPARRSIHSANACPIRSASCGVNCALSPIATARMSVPLLRNHVFTTPSAWILRSIRALIDKGGQLQNPSATHRTTGTPSRMEHFANKINILERIIIPGLRMDVGGMDIRL